MSYKTSFTSYSGCPCCQADTLKITGEFLGHDEPFYPQAAECLYCGDVFEVIEEKQFDQISEEAEDFRSDAKAENECYLVDISGD